MVIYKEKVRCRSLNYDAFIHEPIVSDVNNSIPSAWRSHNVSKKVYICLRLFMLRRAVVNLV